MNKTLKITSIAIILILGLMGFLFFYKNSDGKSGAEIVRNVLPFGAGSDASRTQETNFTGNGSEDFSNTEGAVSVLPTLFQVHKAAVAGAYPFVKKDDAGEEKTLVRYLERSVGHIFETDLSTMQKERISNTTRLKIYEAVWGNNDKNVIIRYLDDTNDSTIRSFAIKLADNTPTLEIPGEKPSVSQETELEGFFLPENITSISVSPDTKKIFYILNTGNRVLGTIYNLESSKTAQIFQSPLTEWLPQWPKEDTVALTTKPSGDIPGFLYFLNTKTEDLSKILSGIKGLTTLTNPNSTKVLYTESFSGGFDLKLYDTKNRSSQTIPFTTLPEKCVWGNENIIYCAVPTKIPTNTYPDAWYQGVVTFSDDIWAFDTETFTTKLLVSPVKYSREEIDAINPSTSSNGKYLFFTNKKDLSLWGVRI